MIRETVKVSLEVTTTKNLTRVRLACEPSLLNDVLGLHFGVEPTIVVATADAKWVDVVVVSTMDGAGQPLEWIDHSWSASFVIALDPALNVLRVRKNGVEKTGERIIGGSLRMLTAVIQELAATGEQLGVEAA